MSVLKAFEEMTGESLTGAAAPNGDQAAIKDAPVSKQGGLLGSLDDIVAEVSASAAPPVAQPAPVSARPAAIPSETETQPAISSGDAAKREADYLGTSLKRGWNTIVSAVAGSNLSKLEQLERDLYRLRSEEDFARDPELRASRDKLRDRMLETAQTIRDVSKENDALLNSQSTRPETKLLYGVGKDERGWVEAAKDVGSAIISNPMSLVDLGLGSGPASLASAASAIAVTLSTKNPVAGATAGGLTSGYVEFGNEYAQQREAGLSHEEAWSKAARKASVVGLLDGVSMSTAGKALDTILDATKGTVAKTALTKTVKETGRQAALGAAGEAGGSLLAGEPISPTNVILEAVGETVTAPIEAVSTARGILGETAAAESRREDVARRAAVRALDPNRDVAIDPIATVRPSDSVRDTVSVEQQATAVTKGLNTPEPPPEDPQAQNLSQQKPSLLNAADEVLNEFESQFVSELDAQDTAVEQPVAPPTFSAAVESMKADLGIDAAETLNLGLVETDTRLNRFKNALESAFGVNVHFVDFGDQLSTGSGQQLGAFNGYRSGDTILVNAKDVDLIDTTWHELTHVLETRYGDVYQSLRDTLVPAMDPAVRQQLVDSLNARRRAEVGRDLTEQELDSELVAYTVGDLVRSPETLGQMFDNFTDPQAAKTFRDVLMDVLQKMLAVIKGPQYIKERARLVEAQKAVTAAFAEFQKRETQKQMSGVAVTDQSAADANTNFARRVKPAPAQTVKAYKLFRVDPKKPGQLFPLFVNANDPVPVGEWLDAESGPAAAGGKVKSKLGPLAYRPGWHAGDLPIATHIGAKSSAASKKPDRRPDNHVWAEVELAADRDWQSVANQRGTNPDGKLVSVRAHITDQIPEDGYYRYKTNPNMTGNWLIGGSMKVNRILPDTEVEQINRAAGTADLPREKPFDPARYGLQGAAPVQQSTTAAPVLRAAQTAPAAPTTAVAQAGQFKRRTKSEIATRLSENKPVTDQEVAQHPELAAVRDGVRELIRRAPAVKAKFDARAKRLAKKHGMQLLAGPIKSEHRAFGKAWFDKGGDFRGLNDIVRSTFVVKDLNDIPAMVEVVLAEFPGSRVRRNGWMNPGDVGKTGYRDVFFENVTFDGFRVELQMNLQPMIDAKQSQGHKLYEEETRLTRQLDDPSLSEERRAELQAKRADNIARQNVVYSKGYRAVLAATKDLNSASDTRLPSESTNEADTGRGGPTPDVEGPSQAMNPSPGDMDTGMPSTSKNSVPSGNELGNDIARTPTILSGNITQRATRSTADLMAVQAAEARAELGLDPNAKTKTRRVGELLNKRTLDAFPVIGDKDTSPEASEQIANAMVEEVVFQLGATSTTGTGLGWYSSNYPRALDRLSRVYPELRTDRGARTVFTALVAITSNGERVATNISNAISLYEGFRNGTKLTELAIGSRRFAAMREHLDTLQALIDKYGMDGFAQPLLEEITVAEINSELRKLGQKTDSSYTAETVMPRSALYFGPKLGAFYANLMGSEGYLTMDLWWSRTFNRMRGTLIPKATDSSIENLRNLLGRPEMTREEVAAASAGPRDAYESRNYMTELELLVGEKQPNTKVGKVRWEAKARETAGERFNEMFRQQQIEKVSNTIYKNEFEMLEEAPFRASDRTFMIETARLAQSKLAARGMSLSLADIQAALWYYEKRLYGKLTGRETDDIGYEEAILDAADRPERPAAQFNRGGAGRDVGSSEGRDAGQDVPADDVRPEPESVGRFSRRLVELAANQDPRAPKLFGISETPTVLRAVGGPRQLLVMEPRNVAKVVSPQLIGRVTEEGGVRRNAAGFMVPAAPRIALTVDELRAIPQMLADPVAIIRQEKTPSRREAYKFLIDMPKGGYPVVAVLHDNVRYGSDRATELVSIYPVNEPNSLDTVNRELNSAQLLYFNKGKAIALSAKIAGKLPSLPKVVPTLAKNPGSVPNRTLPPIPNSNFARNVGGQGQQFTLPSRTLIEKYWENPFTNRMSRVEDVQQAVVKQGGTTELRDAAGNVVGDTNLVRAAETMNNAAAARLREFRDKHEIPLIEEAAKLGVSFDDVSQYLYAIYAPERNAVIQQRNPTQFATDGGSGMTNAEAAQIVARFRARSDFQNIQAIASRVRQIVGMTQNVLLNEGLVEPQIMAQWRKDNPNYVPLRGFEGVDEETGNLSAQPGRLDPRNPFVKTAKGRTTRATDIIENVIKDYADAVALSEKNKVYRILLKFVQDNPDPQLWQVNAPKISRSYFKGGMTPMGYAQGTVRIAYEVNENPNETIAVRVQGRPVFIKINDPGMLDDLRMQAVQFDTEMARQFFNVWKGTMGFIAKTYTALNPSFIAKELFRSTFQTLIWNFTKYGAGRGAGRTALKLLKSAKAAYKAERDANWAGNSDTITVASPNGPRTISVKDAYEMFKADGGRFGFLDIRDVDDIKSEISRRFELAQVAGSMDPRTYHKRMLGAVLKVEDAILDFTAVTDNMYRFATYMSRLEQGATRQEAADAARNVTVNFSAKGKLTPYLSAAYMFFNPAVQGARNTLRAAFKTGWRGYTAVGSMVALGVMLAEAAVQNIGDDDEPYWDKDLYKQAKLRNILLFTEDGDTVTIPLPYGFGFFVNFGYAMHDLSRGVPLAKVAAFMRDSFFTHFSPLGSLENPVTFASPTLLDPIAVIAGNKTDQGMPLMPETPWDPNRPDSEKFWAASRGTMFQQLSRFLNEATGGTPAYSGAVDVSPETLRYAFGFLTGGTGGFIRDAAESVYLSSEIGFETVLDKNKLPILKGFYQKNTGKQDQMQFYRNADAVTAALNEWQELRGTEYAYRDDVFDRLDDQKGMTALAQAVQRHKKSLSDLRKREVMIIEKRSNGEYDAAEAEYRLAEVAERKRNIYTEFNRSFYRVSPTTPK